MKIKVKGIEQVLSTAIITFENRILPAGRDNDFTTPEGTRAIRILEHVVGADHGSYGMGGFVITVAHGGSEHLETLDALQRQMDKYAGDKLQLRFDDAVVEPYNVDRRLKFRSAADLRKWRASRPHAYVQVRQMLHLSLPAAHRDVLRLRKLAPGTTDVRTQARDPYALEIVIVLRDGLFDQDPWTLIKAWEEQVKKAVV